MNITLNENVNQITSGTYSVNANVQNNITNEKADNSVEHVAAILELSDTVMQEGKVTVKSVQNENMACSQTEDFSTLAMEETVSPMAMGTTQIQECQNWLRTLGLYSGSPDGNAGGTELVKSVKNFQRVYGLPVNGTINTTTYNKIKTVCNFYSEIYSSEAMKTLEKSLYLDEHAKKNFAHVWTFLKCGMSFNSHQIAGIMGNIHTESAFASDNAQDSGGYPGEHNSQDYQYDIYDEVAYGLVQWKDSSRKLGLYNMSNNMGRNISDTFVQLAYLREELTGNYSNVATTIKNTYSYSDVADIFRRDFEETASAIEVRRAHAKTIYDAIKGM